MNTRIDTPAQLTFEGLSCGEMFFSSRNPDVVLMKLSDMKSAVEIDAKCLTEADYSEPGKTRTVSLAEPVVRLRQKGVLLLEAASDQSAKKTA